MADVVFRLDTFGDVPEEDAGALVSDARIRVGDLQP